MATDMQPLFSGFPSHHAPALQDARDRQPAFQGPEPSRNFESMLNHAEARQMPAKHDAPALRHGDRTGLNARAAADFTPESSVQRSERSAVSEAPEQTPDGSEQSGDKAHQSVDESEEKAAVQESKKKGHEQETLPQDIMLAAMIVPAATAVPVEEPSAQGETKGNHSEDTVTATATITMDSGTEESAQSTSTVAPAPTGELAAQGVATHAPGATVETGKDATQAKETAGKDTAQREGKDLPPVVGQISGLEGRQADRAEAGEAARVEPNHPNPALAAMTVSKQDPKSLEQGSIDHVDRSTVLDLLAQGTSLSEGQAGSGAGRFMEQDGRSLSDSSAGDDRSLQNQTPSIEQNARPVFLDRMHGLTQPAPSVSESSPGRNESGQATAMLRASESERVNDLRGAAQVSQSVTLDLDPLDMGPLRVRVMMSDQTVHAHIRTEHGELGQGLLQQGQSLESSLRTTGLEMGMLRVTVDQQQGRGENAWMFQQQQHQGRSPSPNMSQTVPREDERAAREERAVGLNERVSFFA